MSHTFPLREDLIGKRILTVRCTSKAVNRNSTAVVRRGVIRASTVRNSQDTEAQVLVEFDDDKSWACRQWISIFKEIDVFLIEAELVWANRLVKSTTELKPALVFTALADKFGYAQENSVFLEFLLDKALIFEKLSSLIPFKVEDVSALVEDERRQVKEWINYHLGQILMLHSPSLADGHQVQVYNKDNGDSQWYNARILSADDQTKLITLLDESKSVQRTENAAFIQIVGLSVMTNPKLWQTALKLAKKRPSEGSDSPVLSKRMKNSGTDDQETSAGHSSHFHYLSNILCRPNEPLLKDAVQCLAASPNASLSKSFGSSVAMKSPLSTYKASYFQSPVLNCASASARLPQCSSSTATNAKPVEDANKFCSLFRYRQISPATYENSSSASLRCSPTGLKNYSSPLLPFSGTHLSAPSQRNGFGVTSDGSCPELPQNGAFCTNGTPAFKHCGSSSFITKDACFQKVPENHKRSRVSEEDGQLHIPVVIGCGSGRGRKHSLPGDQNLCCPNGGDKLNFLNLSPVKSQNLIVVNLVDDRTMQSSRSMRNMKMETSNTAVRTRMNQTGGNHPLNQPRLNRVTPVDQLNVKQTQQNAWMQEMERFVGKKTEERVRQQVAAEELQNRKQVTTGGVSHVSSRSRSLAIYGLKKIQEHQSTLGNSAACNQPNKRSKKLKEDVTDQLLVGLSAELLATKQSCAAAKLTSGIGEKLPTLHNLKSTMRKSNSVRKVSGKVSANALGNQTEILRQCFVRECEEETRGLAEILKLLKILDKELVWPDLLKGDQEEDDTVRTKDRKKLVKTSVNRLHSHPTTPRQPQHDCETKMKQFRNSVLGEQGIESPSCVLSRKPLNGPDALLPRNSFVQEESCLDLDSLITFCRECKSRQKGSDKNAKILCRFFAFRRLNTTKRGSCQVTGFCSPRDADGADLSLWMPLIPIMAPEIGIDMAKYIINNVGNRFCELVEQEKEAMTWLPVYSEIAWKRPVHGVREMCDVCSTTLFNIHWVCGKCGFVVCLDCFRAMTQKCAKCTDDVGCKVCDRGNNRWPRCTHSSRPLHVPSQLMLTQIIPSDVLWSIGRMIHDVRKKWKMFTNCPCGENRQNCQPADESEQPLQELCLATSTAAVSLDEKALRPKEKNVEVSDIPPVTADGVGQKSLKSGIGKFHISSPEKKEKDKEVFERPTSGDTCDRKCPKAGSKNLTSFSALRNVIMKNICLSDVKKECKTLNGINPTLDDVVQRVATNYKLHRIPLAPPLLNMFDPSKESSVNIMRKATPIPRNSLSKTRLQYPDVAHAWLDHGRLLQLTEPRNLSNIQLFQQQWKRGQPVLISNCQRYLNRRLWLPESFAEEFGNEENDLVDCSRKVVLVGHKMQRFWDGFESVVARLKDKHGQPMILKLKDWPPTEDFSELLPSRFEDLVQGLPLPEYTHRTGVFNLVSRLPDFFVRPDLGPKMYNAYGSALYPQVGSTNLHLDMSDAVNLILYVGIPKDDKEDHEAAAVEAMKDAGCCELTIDRILKGGEKPGALWHIFDPQDSDKIRDLLHKVAAEVGEPVGPHHDPIHDQSWYLDEKLRRRLLEEYAVECYTLVQSVGDAIFIPAGAPHQVRNLHSCIKAAEDFVSPENLSYCFKMTQEFRHLSDKHSNHEDKLQVKNIIYHAVKDAIAVLMHHDP